MNALQFDMFSGELKDTRTRQQRKADAAARQPRPAEMFASADVLQFGVRANPTMPIPAEATTRLGLLAYDPRTEEEKAKALQAEAESLTGKLID